jgi:hypothetical protein
LHKAKDLEILFFYTSLTNLAFTFKRKETRITKDIPQANIPTGQLCLNEATKLGLIDCKGKLSEVLRFWDILHIIIYVSSRSVRAYQLWSEYKRS